MSASLDEWLAEDSLTPVQLDIIRCLIKRPGEWVSASDLIRKVWGDSDKSLLASDIHNLRVNLSRIRRKLPPGWIIENHYWHGRYRLIQDGLSPARRVLLENVSERQFRGQVMRWAQARGWLGYFTWRSDHSPFGFPDLVLVRGKRIIFVELKARDGVLSDAQKQWLSALEECPGAEVYVWRPVDETRVLEILATVREQLQTHTNGKATVNDDYQG